MFDADAEKLAAAFWPGPLTLVLPKRPDSGVADLALAGLDSVAVRVPDHPVAQALLKAFDGPVVAPSANRSGHVSPTDAAHVMADLRGRIDLVIDAGPSAVGVESTIVSCLGVPTLLRPGGLAREQIERVLGHALSAAAAPADDDAPLAPGMLASHYAPRAAVRLNATDVRADEAALDFGRALAGFAAKARLDPQTPREGEALLAFGPAPEFSGSTFNLSPRGDLIEAAANLFSHLRALDAAGAKTIAVMSVPRHGLGEAINDRLARAAAPKK